MACDMPPIPPKLEQARQMCNEQKGSFADPRFADIQTACQAVFEKYAAITAPAHACQQGEGMDVRKKFLLDAVK